MKKKKETGVKNDFEIFGYESEAGAICLGGGETAVSVSQKRFLEFADKLNEVCHSVLEKYLRGQKTKRTIQRQLQN